MSDYLLFSKIELIISFKDEYTIGFPKQTESYFQNEWDEQVKKAKERNSLLFNGPLLHVAGWEQIENNIVLQLGLTDYKSYVCSRTKEFKRKFREIQRAMPLAVCVALITSDNKLILEQRKGVDIYNDFFHVVGGFLDPNKDLGQDGLPDPFMAIIREVREEIGLLINFENLLLLGLSEDKIVPHYELCFKSKIKLSSLDVQNKFNEIKTDGEFNYPQFIDFDRRSINSFLEMNKDKISPTGRDCIIMAVL
jgi:hypothetical protein